MKLLESLYKVSSPSGQEKSMRKFITDFCKENLSEITIVKDKAGNLYVTKGADKTYPCIVAHMDEVHQKNKNKEIVIHDNVILGLDRKAMKQTGIGADDKNGIWVALNLLQTEKVLKCAFFVSEEIGCIGSERADMDFFSDVRFVLQCDRRNGSDFICNANGVDLSDSGFIDRCEASKFGYKISNGLQTDVVSLKEKGLNVCAVNLSCGYYNPHQDNEMTRFDELQNCLALCEHIVKTVTDVQSHTYEPKKHFGGTFFTELDDYRWTKPIHQNNWNEINTKVKQVAELEIKDDYIRLSEVFIDADVRLFLKRKYQFLNDTYFIDQCIDSSMNEQVML